MTALMKPFAVHVPPGVGVGIETAGDCQAPPPSQYLPEAGVPVHPTSVVAAGGRVYVTFAASAFGGANWLVNAPTFHCTVPSVVFDVGIAPDGVIAPVSMKDV